jgi:hypothetical protein
MNVHVLMDWKFNPRGSIAWISPDPFWDLVDLDKGRIDTFVAVGRGMPDATAPCTVQFVRIDNARNLELTIDPPGLRWAYSQWLDDQRTIVGDVGLWNRTFGNYHREEEWTLSLPLS